MIIEERIVKSKKEWDNIISLFEKSEIYSKYDYFNLYSSEGETPLLFYVKSSYGEIAYPTMLMDLGLHSNLVGKLDSGKYFDLSSHYGYSGPLIIARSESSKQKLIEELYRFVGDFCNKNNIVSEFVKFSPILKNHIYMDSSIDLIKLKETVVVDLQRYGNPLYGEVKKRKRHDAMKTEKSGVTIELETSPSSLDPLLELYYYTMDRNHASDFFYFSSGYFEKMARTMSDNILFAKAYKDGKLVGFKLCFIYKNIIHSHIAGTAKGYLKYSPGDLLHYRIIEWGYKNKFRYYHIGSGTTTSTDDSLYFYKTSFSKNSSFHIYIGKKIWNSDIYNYISKLSWVDSNSFFFPTYRSL